MKEFYRAYQLHGDAAAALQAAQNYLRRLSAEQIKAARREVEQALAARDVRVPEAMERSKDYSHPYFWAPFILIG